MSIAYKKVMKESREVASVTCSKCSKVITPDNIIEWQEWQSINFTGGYGSKFGDGQTIRIDLCQDCLFGFTKDFYEIEEWDDVEEI